MVTETKPLTERGAYTIVTVNKTTRAVSQSAGTSISNTSTFTRTWSRTPGYRDLVKKSRRYALSPLSLPFNPYSYSRTHTEHLKGVYRTVTTTEDQSRIGCYGSFQMGNLGIVNMPVPSSEVSALDGRLRNAILNDLKDSKVNAAQAYAERKQTADLIAATAIRCAQAFRSLRRGDIVQAGRHLGCDVKRAIRRRYNAKYPVDPNLASSAAWLELQYGWKPLLSDVYGASELIAQKVSRELTGRKSKVGSIRRRDVLDFPSVPGASDISGTQIRELTHTIKYVVFYGEENPTLHTMAQLGLTNPLNLAWELLPFSFVVDWFLPVGNYLSSLDATIGLKFKGGTVTSVTQTKTTMIYAGKPKASFPNNVGTNLRGSDERLTITRSVLTSWPRPAIPSFKNPLSFDHVTNAIALLVQVFDLSSHEKPSRRR